MTSDELAVLYVFAKNYRAEIWTYGTCYEVNELLSSAHRADQVLSEIHDYTQPYSYREEAYAKWSYQDQALFYKYRSRIDGIEIKTTGEIAREIAGKYGHDEKWIGAFRPQFTRYAKAKARQGVPERVIKSLLRMGKEGLPIPQDLQDDYRAIMKAKKDKNR
jgi:hypothetical protein